MKDKQKFLIKSLIILMNICFVVLIINLNETKKMSNLSVLNLAEVIEEVETIKDRSGLTHQLSKNFKTTIDINKDLKMSIVLISALYLAFILILFLTSYFSLKTNIIMTSSSMTIIAILT